MVALGATLLLGFNPKGAVSRVGGWEGAVDGNTWCMEGVRPKFHPTSAVGCGGTEPEPRCLPHLPPQALLKTGEHSWSLAELVQALVLLTHYHSLASFVFGCGINPEAGQDGGHGCRPPSPHSDSSPTAEDSTGCSGVRDGGELPPSGVVPSCWGLPHKP